MKTSISEPPIWKPTLPPSMRMAPGADQPTPSFLRQERKPLPYLPPTMNAPFFRSGTITIHCALLRRSCGIALSGVPITSLNDSAALCRRLGASEAAQTVKGSKMAEPAIKGSEHFQFRWDSLQFDSRLEWIATPIHDARLLAPPCRVRRSGLFSFHDAGYFGVADAIDPSDHTADFGFATLSGPLLVLL